jgi:tetratricopeptide (TPR) repeat protein
MLKYLQKFDFTSLFINELGWDYPSNNQIELTISNQKYFLKSLAEKRGFVVYECKTLDVNEIPSISIRRRIDEFIKEYTYEHLLIYTDSQHTKQIWQWVRRINGEILYREYLFDSQNKDLLARLSLLYFSLIEETSLSLIKVIKKIQLAFDDSSDSSIFVLPERNISQSSYFWIVRNIVSISIPYRLVSINHEFEYILKIADLLEFDNDVRMHFDNVLQRSFYWDEIINFMKQNSDEILSSLSYKDRELLKFKYEIYGDEYSTPKKLDSLEGFYLFYCNNIEYTPSIRVVPKKENQDTINIQNIDYQNQEYESDVNQEARVYTEESDSFLQIDDHKGIDNFVLLNENLQDSDYNLDYVQDENYTNQNIDNNSEEIEQTSELILDVNIEAVTLNNGYNSESLQDKVDNNESLEEEVDDVQKSHELNTLGIELIDSSNYEQAITIFDKAIKLNPDLYEAWFNRGLALRNLSKYQESIKSYLKALTLESDDLDISYEIACCYALQRKVQKSVVYLRKVISLSPEIYIEKVLTDSDFDLIREYSSFKVLINSDSNKIDDLYYEATSMITHRNYLQAITIYNEILNIKSDHVKALIGKGSALFTIKSYHDALQILKYVTTLDSENFNVWNMLGSIYFQLIDYDQAFTCYSKALGINPDSYEALYGEGEIFNRKKIYLEAARCYEQSIFINGLYEPAIRRLNEVNEILKIERKKHIEKEAKQRLEELKQVELEREYREEAKLRELENQRLALEKAKLEEATAAAKLRELENQRLALEKVKLEKAEKEAKRKKLENQRLASEKAKLELEKKKQIEDERNRREKRNQDPVTKIFNFVKRLFS